VLEPVMAEEVGDEAWSALETAVAFVGEQAALRSDCGREAAARDAEADARRLYAALAGLSDVLLRVAAHRAAAAAAPEQFAAVRAPTIARFMAAAQWEHARLLAERYDDLPVLARLCDVLPHGASLRVNYVRRAGFVDAMLREYATSDVAGQRAQLLQQPPAHRAPLERFLPASLRWVERVRHGAFADASADLLAAECRDEPRSRARTRASLARLAARAASDRAAEARALATLRLLALGDQLLLARTNNAALADDTSGDNDDDDDDDDDEHAQFAVLDGPVEALLAQHRDDDERALLADSTLLTPAALLVTALRCDAPPTRQVTLAAQVIVQASEATTTTSTMQSTTFDIEAATLRVWTFAVASTDWQRIGELWQSGELTDDGVSRLLQHTPIARLAPLLRAPPLNTLRAAVLHDAPSDSPALRALSLAFQLVINQPQR
jgi:hypothetical protein